MDEVVDDAVGGFDVYIPRSIRKSNGTTQKVRTLLLGLFIASHNPLFEEIFISAV